MNKGTAPRLDMFDETARDKMEFSRAKSEQIAAVCTSRRVTILILNPM